MRFGSYAPQALRAAAGAARTIAERRSICHHWLDPTLGNLDLGDIGPAQVADVLDAVRVSGCGEARVHAVLACLRSIVRQALAEGLLHRDPTAGFKVRIPRTTVTALSPEQRDALDAVLYERPIVGAGALRVMLWTGLRLSEVLALRHGDYDPVARVLTVHGGKTDAAARRVDVPDCIAEKLEKLPFMQLHPTTLRRALGAACQAAGIPHIRVHDLRHTRITTQLLAGVPVGYVSKQAGHASPATTLEIYDHWIQVAGAEQRRAWTNA